METERAERDRRWLLLWVMAAPAVAAVLAVCAIEAWHLATLLIAQP
jgi:hypothetical protein